MPRLARYWFAYMAGLGLVYPYQALYLKENAALTGTEVGLVLAVRPLVGIAAQPLWGWIADRTGSRARVLTCVALGYAAALVLIARAQGFGHLVLAFALAACFGTSMMPMGISATMASLGDALSERFGRVRVWGTVGYLLLVVSFPWLLHRWQAFRGLVTRPGGPAEPGLEVIFLLAAVFVLGAAGMAWRMPAGAGARVERAAPGDLRRLLRHPPFRRALLFVFAAFFLLQGPIQLFPVLVRARGGSLETLSLLWIPMLLVEIPMVLFSDVGLRRIGARGLLTMGVLADGVRWVGTALAPNLPVMFVLQLLHGVVIGGLMMGVALYVEAVVPARLRSSGQGVVAMVGVSLAGMLSAAWAGAAIDAFGATAPYLVGGGGALVLAAGARWVLPHPSRPPEEAADVAQS